jgi:aminomethyltransferase
MTEISNTALKKTPLHALHVKLGGRMVEFGGYDMPIQYPEGIMAEHNWTRAHAGLFDVSHMGPSFLALPELGGGDDAHRKVAAIIEKLVPSDIAGLVPGKVQLTVLLNENGGIIDDLMIGRPADPARQGMLYIVVNAGTKDNDFALIQKIAGTDAELRRADDRALIALQGPEAEAVIASIIPEAVALTFMNFVRVEHPEFGRMIATRCGYTGEDGFEILVPAEKAEAFAERLLSDTRVKPIGLGARDSLRLEGGMCLYGHDIDTTKTPVSASLAWMVSKARRETYSRRTKERRSLETRWHQTAGPRACTRRHGSAKRGRPGCRRHHIGRLRAVREWPRRARLCRYQLCQDRDAAEADRARQGAGRRGRGHAVRSCKIHTLRGM